MRKTKFICDGCAKVEEVIGDSLPIPWFPISVTVGFHHVKDGGDVCSNKCARLAVVRFLDNIDKHVEETKVGLNDRTGTGYDV